MSRQITRRGFVAGTAVAAGLVGLVGCNGGASDPLAAPAADKYPIDPDGEKVEAKFAIEELRDGWTRATQEGRPPSAQPTRPRSSRSTAMPSRT